jgi:hypothetical protein
MGWTSHVRRTRSFVIRTRMPLGDVQARIAALVRGADRTADGAFAPGSTNGREFSFGFAMPPDSDDDVERFDVSGRIQDSAEWRSVHVRVVPRDSWTGTWATVTLLFGGSLAAFAYFLRELSVETAAFVLAFGVGLNVLLALLLDQNLAAPRVANRVARAIEGTVHLRGHWTEPPPEGHPRAPFL